MLPLGDLQHEEEEGDYGPPDPDDDADFEPGGGVPSWADPQDPLANFKFIKELEELSSFSGPDIAELLSDLPVPQDGDVEGM